MFQDTYTYINKVKRWVIGLSFVISPLSFSHVVAQDKIVNPDLLVRRINISANNIIDETEMSKQLKPVQLDLFIDYEEELRKKEEEQKMLAKERRIQEAQLAIKKSFGKNAILNGISFAEGATAKERNMQIGGHKE